MEDSTPSGRQLLSSALWLGLLGTAGAVVTFGSTDGATQGWLLTAFGLVLAGVAAVGYRGLGRARREAMPPTRIRVWHYVLPTSAVVVAGAVSDALVNTLGAVFSGVVLGIGLACAAEAARLTRRG